MAKRKRLELPREAISGDLETKSPSPSSRVRMPIAEVAGATAGHAALEEVARAMTEAEEEGRIVKKIPIDRIAIHHLSRDRMVVDEEDMAVLKASLADRGQQTPVEVVQTGADAYGLISGMRRVLALTDLGATEVLALVRRPETAEAAYVAMVEENEIRSALSFYERANLAVASVEAGVHPDPRTAVARLFANVPAPKRSKILNFVTIRRKLGASLRFPAAIPEKLGLPLAAALEADAKLAARISDALRRTPPADAAAERRTLERALKRAAPERPGDEIAPGIALKSAKGRVVISGKGVTADFIQALRDWTVSHAK